ncbi:hypothetical protein JL722_13751 [Aureococcus anophagefferens]|nr:hypothetical protein JL722_13751 [Aureococcus anophagefferens]
MSHDDIIIMKGAEASDVEGHAKGAEAPEKQPTKEHTTTKWRRAVALISGGGPSSYGGDTRAAALGAWRADALAAACPLALLAPCSSRPSAASRRANARALAAVHEDLPDHAATLLRLLDAASIVAGCAILAGALLVGAAAASARRHGAGLGGASARLARRGMAVATCAPFLVLLLVPLAASVRWSDLQEQLCEDTLSLLVADGSRAARGLLFVLDHGAELGALDDAWDVEDVSRDGALAAQRYCASYGQGWNERLFEATLPRVLAAAEACASATATACPATCPAALRERRRRVPGRGGRR